MRLVLRASILSSFVLLTGCPDEPTPPPPATRPATAPASMPATTQAAKLTPLVELLDAIRRDDPDFPTTQPLSSPIELPAAARLKRAEPTYLCSRGDVWITRDDAPPTPEALKLAMKKQTHVVRDRPRFVYWRPGTTPWSPELIVRENDRDVWVTQTARVALEAVTYKRDWSRAFGWNTTQSRAIAVPTDDGYSVLTLEAGKVDEKHVHLATPAAGTLVYSALDARGLLAWSTGSETSAVARFFDGKWQTLTPSRQWPESLVHVVPFQDGSVLTIAADGDALVLRSTPLDTVAVDEGRVRELVKKLAAQLPEDREVAQNELANIGPAAWPLLEKLAETQRAEARIRIRAILGNQTTPTLGGIAPLPGPGRVVSRLGDGGVVLYFANGATAVDRNGVVQRTVPAWLAVRTSGPIRTLPPGLAKGISSDRVGLVGWGDEWIVEHDVDGPLRWMGNHFESLTRTSEGDFKRFVGIDSAARWLFKTIDPDGPTLILDPTLPDPRPRLPVWTIEPGRGGRAGWTDEDWPAIARGGGWVLKEEQWAALKGDAAEKLKTEAVAPSTAPTTSPTTAPSGLLTDGEGNVYTEGTSSLVIRRKSGDTLTWPLPPEAVGTTPPVLIEAEDRLFLFNTPGRIVRLRRQFDRAEPLKLDGIFTRNVPGRDVRRIWKDPAGRIIIAHGGDALAVCFPSGRISYELSNMIPAAQLRDALRAEDEPETEERK